MQARFSLSDLHDRFSEYLRVYGVIKNPAAGIYLDAPTLLFRQSGHFKTFWKIQMVQNQLNFLVNRNKAFSSKP